MTWTPIASLAALVLAGSPALAQNAKPDEWRWRYFENDGVASLVVAHTDLGTDNFDSLTFSCKPASNSVKAKYVMAKPELKALGALLQAGEYPRGQLMPAADEGSLLLEPEYSEMNGWFVSFDLRPDAAFDLLKKTGRFQFSIGSTRVKFEMPKGLDAVGRFQQTCRKAQ